MAADAQTSLNDVVGAIWDLRDDAYDHPREWKAVTAEAVFQAVGDVLERAIDAGGNMDWKLFPTVVREALLGRPPEA
jgi:hypothetical protein